ncbi:MAG: XTP/dITP diphosphatase [Roseburia sp.]|nr:XTP/dITP diphosphatase [Ruminococcus sp.]MCM1156564.1 XTP/dITP diphosphatase [Roseburia sp.]MCM1241395.1 XTP/dITP diphosphatase [Roseburia sp.]
MERTIIFATGNEGKMREIRQILEGMDAEILSMKQAGITADIVEDGTTFMENAIIKAKAVAAKTDHIVLADDSGLEIDYLHKEPGIYSARYLGEDTPYDIKNAQLLKRMEGVEEEKRTARFICAIAAVFPDGELVTTQGIVEGRIAHQIEGANGFGYDPIFYLPEYGCTSAQISEEEKNAISHRGRALRKMREELEKRI